MGPAAGKAAAAFISERRWQAVISAGFAGGASAGLQVGDLVIASEVIEESTGRRFKPTGSWDSGRVAGARVGPFLTVEKALAAPAEKSERGKRFGALAVEMETAGIAEAAARAGVPWVGLRAILDPMEEPLAVSSQGQGLAMLFRPAQWRRMGLFLESVRTARDSLARGLEILIKEA